MLNQTYLSKRSNSVFLSNLNVCKYLSQVNPLYMNISKTQPTTKITKKLIKPRTTPDSTNYITTNNDNMGLPSIFVCFSAYKLRNDNINVNIYFRTHGTLMKYAQSIRVITKLPNSEQSYKGKVKTHNYINRQNQSTTGKL